MDWLRYVNIDVIGGPDHRRRNRRRRRRRRRSQAGTGSAAAWGWDGEGWSGVQSGHSQVTVRSQSGLQSGHSQVLQITSISCPALIQYKYIVFLLKIAETQIVLVFTRPDCDLTVDLTVT